ncbi:MAG: MMPL family transporter [Bacteroidetes bacterium]|nr:MMPL family transporter [Bacteroidota bacterium]
MKRFNEVESQRDDIVPSIKKTLDKYYKGYALGGLSVINEATNKTISSETVRSTLLSGILVILLLSYYTRRRRFLFIVLFATVLPMFYLGGLFVLMGFKLNLVSTIIPTLVLVSGISDTVHIINIYNYLGITEPNISKQELINKTVRYSFLPCMLTSVTTMFSFLTLYLSPMPAIRDTGLFSCIGMGVEVICAYIVCICGFMMLNKPSEEKEWGGMERFVQMHQNIMNWVVRITESHRKIIVTVFSLVLITAALSIYKIEVNTYNIEYLSKKSQARVDHERMEKTMGPYLRFEMLVKTKDHSSIISKQNMIAINAFERECENQKLFADAFSFVDLAKHINKKTTGFSGFTSPMFQSEDALRHFWSKEPQVRELIDSAFDEIRVAGRIKMSSSKEYDAAIQKSKEIFKETVPANLGLEVSMEGYAPLYVLMNDYIVDSQAKSFVGSFILIFIPFFFFYKSGKITLLAIYSNIVPLAAVAVVMALGKIPLDNGSAMISAIILGIAVNNTIHFTNMFLRERKRGLNAQDAVNSSLMITGNAIISSSVTVLIGFVVIASSAVSTLSSFGILCGMAVVMGMFSDLLLMPSLTKAVKK